MPRIGEVLAAIGEKKVGGFVGEFRAASEAEGESHIAHGGAIGGMNASEQDGIIGVASVDATALRTAVASRRQGNQFDAIDRTAIPMAPLTTASGDVDRRGIGCVSGSKQLMEGGRGPGKTLCPTMGRSELGLRDEKKIFAWIGSSGSAQRAQRR